MNNTLLQSQSIHHQRKLSRPNFESKLLIAAGVSLLSYSQRSLRNLVKMLNSEIQNLFGADWHLYYSDLFSSSWYQTFTSRFGEAALDQWTALISLAKDIHSILFHLNYQYLLLVYRLFRVRTVTTSPKQSVRYLLLTLFRRINYSSDDYSSTSLHHDAQADYPSILFSAIVDALQSSA